MIDTIKQYAKFIAALIGAFAVAFAGLLPAEVAPWIQAVAAFLSAIAVFSVPNEITDSQVRSAAKHLEEPGAVAASLLTEENRRAGFER